MLLCAIALSGLIRSDSEKCLMAATFVPIGCGIIEERDHGFSEPGRVKRWPKRAWSEAFVYQTPYYTVRTNTSPDVAMYIGKLMERAFAGYREVLGYRDVSLPRLTINTYATRKEYDTVARRLGLSTGITAGLYTPVPPAAIHLPYTKDLRGHPSRTLLHEGTHQFVDQAVRFLVPPVARSTLSPAKHTLVSVPLWLNEGLATYMESAAVTEDGFEIGRINRTRLVHLQKLIRTRKCPPLRKVL